MRISDWSSDVCSSDLANSRGLIFDVRHAFRAARDHHVRRARLHHHCGLDDRLQSRTASAVELEARHRLRETRREPGPAPDARRFPARIALPDNDIVDPFGVDAAALDNGPEDQSSTLTDGQRRQPAAEYTDSCPADRKSTRLNSS